MTLENFIHKITENGDTLEFQKPPVEDGGYKMRIVRITEDGRLYQVSWSITGALIRDLHYLHNVSPWEHLHVEISKMMEDMLSKPYPEDATQPERRLVKYVRDFINEHQIHCGEKIHQSDELNIVAPEFMDKCCEIIGYYKEADE